MKSPHQLADQLVRRWQRSDWREQHLLRGRQAWPLHLAIGEPGASSFRDDDSAALRLHLQQWRQVTAQGPGKVQWKPRQYRNGAAPVDIPMQWILRPSDCAAAFARYGDTDGAQASADYHALTLLLPQVDACFHRLLLRRLRLWRDIAIEQVVTATRIALQLEPGCAQGRPLRAMAVAGNDSKFFERHASLVTALLDERFEGEPSRQGLAVFLGACIEDDHWLLVAPLAPSLLPFARQRVTATELRRVALPATHVLLVENERCLHQLAPLPQTIAILGAGLDLDWLNAPWLQTRTVGYWGDLDTWGLAMLSRAREVLPGLHALLMNRRVFDQYRHLAVAESVHAPGTATTHLLPEELALYHYLCTQSQGRVEQEFLSAADVQDAIANWVQRGSSEHDLQ